MSRIVSSASLLSSAFSIVASIVNDNFHLVLLSFASMDYSPSFDLIKVKMSLGNAATNKTDYFFMSST